MKLYTKEEIVQAMQTIFSQGWHSSMKKTITTRNDGAVGNTLEKLLGIKENNLPIPNAREWELKGQRSHTKSLVTLKHIEPSPIAAKIVSTILLPLFGWKHKQAGKKYPITEKSFRSTTSAKEFTNRGFRIIVDRQDQKVCFTFDATKANTSKPSIVRSLKSVEERVGLGPINPEPYWGFEDMRYAIGSKIMNCFYVIAESKVENKHEYFKYIRLLILSGFSFGRFLNCIEEGAILIDFDARTGHNHGTKFRIRQGRWTDLYENVEQKI